MPELNNDNEEESGGTGYWANPDSLEENQLMPWDYRPQINKRLYVELRLRVRRLNGKQREVMNGYLDGKTLVQIASEMNISYQAVQQIMKRAISNLRRS